MYFFAASYFNQVTSINFPLLSNRWFASDYFSTRTFSQPGQSAVGISCWFYFASCVAQTNIVYTDVPKSLIHSAASFRLSGTLYHRVRALYKFTKHETLTAGFEIWLDSHEVRRKMRMYLISPLHRSPTWYDRDLAGATKVARVGMKLYILG